MGGIAGEEGVALLIGRDLAEADVEGRAPGDGLHLCLPRQAGQNVGVIGDEPAKTLPDRDEGADLVAAEGDHDAIRGERPVVEVHVRQAPFAQEAFTGKADAEALAHRRMGAVGADEGVGADGGRGPLVLDLAGPVGCGGFEPRVPLDLDPALRQRLDQQRLGVRLRQRQDEVEAVRNFAHRDARQLLRAHPQHQPLHAQAL